LLKKRLALALISVSIYCLFTTKPKKQNNVQQAIKEKAAKQKSQKEHSLWLFF